VWGKTPGRVNKLICTTRDSFVNACAYHTKPR
jgi:hypothetical protein